MSVRGIRGAVQAEANTAEAIFAATRTLLEELQRRNEIATPDVASVFLTATTDLDAAFPAYAVRKMPGWDLVPLLGAQETDVPGAMERVIRVLLHVNSDRTQNQFQHVYLGRTTALRPDLAAQA
jgi:chorismate mutase